MKSIIEQTIYAGLGLLNEGTGAITDLGQRLAKTAGVSEAEGRRMARRIRAESSKAVKSIQKNLDEQVTHIADVIHAAIRKTVETGKPKTARPSSKKAHKHKAARNRRKTTHAAK